MTTTKPLRLWPALVLVALIAIVWLGAPLLGPDYQVLSLLGSVAGGALLLLWWLLFSRAPWIERLGALVVIVLAVIVTKPLMDPSITGAAMGNFFYILAIPSTAIAIVAAAWLTRTRSANARRVAGVAAILIACAAWAVSRTGGVDGSGDFDFHWRWTPTPEQRLLAQTATEQLAPLPAAPAAAPASVPAAPDATTAAKPETAATAAPETAPPAATPPARSAEWPGFRGRARDSVVRGPRIVTDWNTTKPVEVWRRPIGPGWSSFAVDGDVFYTQEQRGEEEIVSAYRVSTGQPVWRHRDPVRFYESNAGPGPRSTPTLHEGRVYTLGATGIVNALDARSGQRIWSRDARKDSGREIPIWGFSSSPVVTNDMVIVAVAGQVVAYERASGNPKWQGPNGAGGYSSPQLLKIDGVEQIVHMSGTGARGLGLADGKVLWEHGWAGTPIIQPAMLADGDLLINTADMNGGLGIRRLTVKQGSSGWSVQERWTSRGLKPYFNDYVIHNGHAYGFDGAILSCINLADGERKWKGGRYGNGQLILLADQDVLIVLSEDGDVALVGATPDKFAELGKIPALNAKTWNHPVLAGNMLLVRNGEEMVAFRLGTAGS